MALIGSGWQCCVCAQQLMFNRMIHIRQREENKIKELEEKEWIRSSSVCKLIVLDLNFT